MRIILKRSVTDLMRHPMRIKTQFAGILVSVVMVGCIFLMAAKDQPEPGSS